MKRKKSDSVCDNECEQKNPMEGKKVRFVEDENDPENGDGFRGHLEITGDTELQSGFYEKYIKRILDIFLSFTGMVVLSPVLAGIALAIMIDDPGPVLFTQKRIGKNKAYFKFHKFRSMKMETPHDVPTHMLEHPEQYLTKTGRILRKYSLDELPQIWDIFVGNMSIVGPRPALWNQDYLIDRRERYRANDIRPGLTGWAQTHGRDELEIEEKARLDGYYAEHMGLSMDIRCFLLTIISVLRTDGVVEGGTGAVRAKKEKKKILVITNHSYMLWRFRRELIAELMKEHEVILSMPFVGHEDDFRAMGLTCIDTLIDRRGINPAKDWKLICAYRRMLEEVKPDLVITYSIKPNIYAGLLCGRMGIPFYANVQGLGTAFQKAGLAQLVTWLYRVSFRNVRMVFFENEENAADFRKRNIVSASKQTVLHGAGINLKQYTLEPYPENNRLHFLFMGRIMKEKGMDELLAAVKRLHLEHKNFVLDLVGFFEEEYENQVTQMEKDGVVIFHGFQKEPRPFYAAADCVVMPSYHEGMSNVLLEAAATGRPLITSDIPGCREAVDDGDNGFLVEAKNADQLYEAMKRMLGMNAAERRRMGLAGRKKMEREFDKRIVVAETIRMMGIKETMSDCEKMDAVS